MLYSESKERESRFVTTLKIVSPFLLLLAIFLGAFKHFENDTDLIILLIILVPIYVYYIFYLIYSGFRLSLIDPKTKAFTCKAFERLYLKKRQESPYTFTLLYLQNLVDINERYGMMIGDSVLKKMVVELHRFLEESGYKEPPIGRCGGGYFALILQGDVKPTHHLLTIFTKGVKFHGIDDVELKLRSVSLNVEENFTLKELMDHALMLLEEEEENTLTLFGPKALQEITQEILKEGCFSFRYHSVYETKSRDHAFVEVYPRLETQRYGTLSKSQIDRIINHSGYEKSLTQKMVQALLEETALFLKEGKMITLELSANTLRQHHFKTFLTQTLHHYGISPTSIILEFHEKKSYEDSGRFYEILKSYQDLGFKIALGHFGGDNCGLEYLKTLPIDMVKYDIIFTKQIDHPKTYTLLTHLLELCRDLEIRSMIKFIDKEPLFEKIVALKPDYMQGFYFSKPKKLEEIVV